MFRSTPTTLHHALAKVFKSSARQIAIESTDADGDLRHVYFKFKKHRYRAVFKHEHLVNQEIEKIS